MRNRELDCTGGSCGRDAKLPLSQPVSTNVSAPVVFGQPGMSLDEKQDLAYGLIEHSGEHYGQLVVYYRVAGMVPPESRPRK